MMDIDGNKLGGLVNVTSMLARVAVAKNHEIRELIREPAQKEEVQEAREPEKASKVSAVAPSDAPDTNTNAQTTGRLVNVNV